MKADLPKLANEGLMKKIAVGVAVALLMFSGSAFAEEKIRIAGSGSMISLLNELTKAYAAEHKDVVFDINQKSIESTGGVRAAAAGQIEIGLVSRSLKDDEKALVHAVEISRVATVIGVNRSVTIKAITSEQLCKIYSGNITNWKDLGGAAENIVPLTRPDRDATKETVRKSLACFRELKESATVVTVPTSPEMTKMLSSRPDTIGFTDSVALDDSAGAIIGLTLDGVAPTSDNVRNARYKIIKNNYLVTKGEPRGAVKAFIDFVKGPKGAKIIEANKAVPVK
ncbi:MAG: substrate-binding domain-containing protein [Nitrospirae bacterium]|nr:substrate-binding domain-containing protein [Nitrospirota bacterium]